MALLAVKFIPVNSLQLPGRFHARDLLDVLLLVHCLDVLALLDVLPRQQGNGENRGTKGKRVVKP